MTGALSRGSARLIPRTAATETRGRRPSDLPLPGTPALCSAGPHPSRGIRRWSARSTPPDWETTSTGSIGRRGRCRGSREEAEDLVQETYARVLARPRLLRNEDDLGYLLRALRNTFLNQKRTESRRLRPDRSRTHLELVADPHAREPRPRSKQASSMPRSPPSRTTFATCSWRSTSPASRTRRPRMRCGSAKDGDEPALPRASGGRSDAHERHWRRQRRQSPTRPCRRAPSRRTSPDRRRFVRA